MPETETLSARVSQLSPAKRALMERFKRGEFSGVGGARTIPPRPRHQPLPQSFALRMFLVAFVLYYFINWKYLSTVWPLQ